MGGFAGALPGSQWFPDSSAFPGTEPLGRGEGTGLEGVCPRSACSIVMGGAGGARCLLLGSTDGAWTHR